MVGVGNGKSVQSTRADHRKGISIAIAGVMCATPDAVLMRWAQETKATMNAILFWKSLSMTIVIYLYAFTEGKPVSLVFKSPFLALALGSAQALAIFCLSYGFVLTYAATAVFLFSLHPLHSGILGRVFLNDTLPRRTIFALFVAIGCMLIMFYPQLATGDFGGPREAWGDLLSFASSILMATFLILTRGASRIAPDLSIQIAQATGFAFSTLIIFLIAKITHASVLDGMTLPGFIACILDGISVGGVNIAFAIAPKYVNATQVGLISLIEAVLGPLWVLAIYKEVPPIFTTIGGCLILINLAVHEISRPEDEDSEETPLDATSSKKATSTSGETELLARTGQYNAI